MTDGYDVESAALRKYGNAAETAADLAWRMQAMRKLAERRVEYGQRDEPKSFDQRLSTTPDQAGKSVREAFG